MARKDRGAPCRRPGSSKYGFVAALQAAEPRAQLTKSRGGRGSTHASSDRIDGILRIARGRCDAGGNAHGKPTRAFIRFDHRQGRKCELGTRPSLSTVGRTYGAWGVLQEDPLPL